MSSWIRTDWDFGLGMIRLVIGHRELSLLRDRGNEYVKALVASLQSGNPDAIEYDATALIQWARPALMGGQLVQINASFMSWEFVYVHASLPRSVPGSTAEKRSLFTCRCGQEFGESRYLIQDGCGDVEVCETCYKENKEPNE